MLKTAKYREIVRTLAGSGALALAMALMASSASAQTMHPISAMGAGLAGTYAGVTCPNGTDNCTLNTISGTVSKTIGTLTSTGILNVTLYSDESNASVLTGPNANNCYATEGKGSISSGGGTNVLKFKIYGLICEASVAGCGAGPLSFAITAGVGIFANATGTGTFNTQSNSCFHSSDAQITMQGLIFK